MAKFFVLKQLALFLLLSTPGLIIFILSPPSTSSQATGLSLTALSNSTIGCAPVSSRAVSVDSLEEVFTNDNRKSAGKFVDGVLYLNLEVRTGSWYPESHNGLPIKVHAFAEIGKPMQLPGPLIRVPEGTLIKATVRNSILDSPLVLHGFHSRPGDGNDSAIISYGETREFQFTAGTTGTYFYNASAGNRKVDGLPYYTDSQLYGALIVDDKNKQTDPEERIFMIGIWNDTLLAGQQMSNEELAINGLSWPYTERLTYMQNKEVQWRVINVSNQAHPMHLHGFYFTLNSKGNSEKDNVFEAKDRRTEVTELLHPHQTMTLTWKPEKPGNWLFHCHTLVHILPFSFLRTVPNMSEHEMNDVATHAMAGMGGLMLGIHVLPTTHVKPDHWHPKRKLTLIAKDMPERFGKLPAKGFVLLEETDNLSKAGNITVPGPLIVLQRNEPVAIKIINTLNEATTVHWHGLEIESYFDGAAGWGNNDKKLAPLILPGSSFVANLLPPRSGTFIYHTHMHNEQLVAGMYGPLIVLEPGQKFNPETDKIFFMSSSPPLEPPVAILNGSANPDTMKLKAGTIYRLRLINISAINSDLQASLLFNGRPARWVPIAKDGADLPSNQRVACEAASQEITIGETRDFEFRPVAEGTYSFEVRSSYGSFLYATMIMTTE
jgi:manganese oxidase